MALISLLEKIKKKKRTKPLSKAAASRWHCRAWVRAWVTVWRTWVGVSAHTQSATWSSVSPHYSSSIHTVRSYAPQKQPRIWRFLAADGRVGQPCLARNVVVERDESCRRLCVRSWLSMFSYAAGSPHKMYWNMPDEDLETHRASVPFM